MDITNKKPNMQYKVTRHEIRQNGKHLDDQKPTMPTNHVKPMSTSDGGPDKDIATEYCEPGRKVHDPFRSLVHES